MCLSEPNWEWIEAEVRAPGEWAQMAELAERSDLEELSPHVIANMLRAALSDAALRSLLDDRGDPK